MNNQFNENKTHSLDSPLNSLGERIQQLRRQRGISQEELANTVNVSRQAVSKWESAQAQPELEKLLALSDFFQVSADYLLKGEAAPTPTPTPAAQAITPPTVTVLQPVSHWQTFLINATLFNYVGLLVGWALWDYWLLNIYTVVSIIMSIIGAAVLAVGLSRENRAENRQQLWLGFWRWNIWPIAQLALGIIYGFLSSDGSIITPVISTYFFGWSGPGSFVFCWGAWLIICLYVWRACRPRRTQK